MPVSKLNTTLNVNFITAPHKENVPDSADSEISQDAFPHSDTMNNHEKKDKLNKSNLLIEVKENIK